MAIVVKQSHPQRLFATMPYTRSPIPSPPQKKNNQVTTVKGLLVKAKHNNKIIMKVKRPFSKGHFLKEQIILSKTSYVRTRFLFPPQKLQKPLTKPLLFQILSQKRRPRSAASVAGKQRENISYAQLSFLKVKKPLKKLISKPLLDLVKLVRAKAIRKTTQKFARFYERFQLPDSWNLNLPVSSSVSKVSVFSRVFKTFSGL